MTPEPDDIDWIARENAEMMETMAWLARQAGNDDQAAELEAKAAAWRRLHRNLSDED